MLTKTAALAHFLRTTGPPTTTRSASSHPTTTTTTTTTKAKHIPLSVRYQPKQQQQQSHLGISTHSLPQEPTTENSNNSRHCRPRYNNQPRVLAQRQEPEADAVCCHCKTPLLVSKQARRRSCPAAIHYSPAPPPPPQLSSQEAKTLLSMIERLQAQLAKEQASRRALELALETQKEQL